MRWYEGYVSGLDVVYGTEFGVAVCGDSLEVMQQLKQRGLEVDLVFTSPPYGIVTEKEFSSPPQDGYVDWIMPFIEQMRELIRDSGSICIDLRPTYVKGKPFKSTYPFKLLIELENRGFLLCQDFYYINTTSMPAKGEWVARRKIRLKDAVNVIWWLAKSEQPYANNQAALKNTSQRSLATKPQRNRVFPSGHKVSSRMYVPRLGSIRPNYIALAHADSSSYYLRKCRQLGLKIHPTRFPQELPELFIRLTTKPADLVLDPFAGSNTTGAAAEALGRRWLAIELDRSYLVASKLRFDCPPKPKLEVAGQPKPKPRRRKAESNNLQNLPFHGIIPVL